MNAEYRESLLSLTARLDQMLAETDDIIAGPPDVELGCWADDVRESIAEMQSVVASRLEQCAL